LTAQALRPPLTEAFSTINLPKNLQHAGRLAKPASRLENEDLWHRDLSLSQIKNRNLVAKFFV
jgi:hypothetical protein